MTSDPVRCRRSWFTWAEVRSKQQYLSLIVQGFIGWALMQFSEDLQSRKTFPAVMDVLGCCH